MTFELECDAGDAGQFHSSAKRASVTVGQRILRDGVEEIWDSVVVLCEEEEGGALAIRVVLCHPDWDEPREVAVVRSSQKDAPLRVQLLRGSSWARQNGRNPAHTGGGKSEN